MLREKLCQKIAYMDGCFRQKRDLPFTADPVTWEVRSAVCTILINKFYTNLRI